MKKNKMISSKYYSSLKCRIFILGASSEGESIIFEVYDKDDIIYSCITDSFALNGDIIPIKIAQENSINKIYDVFWTHPHDDHSIGLIEIINTYKPENIYLPPNLIELPDSITTNSSEILKGINGISGYDARKKYNCNVTEVFANTLLLEETLHVNGMKIPFSIFAFAPVAGKIRKNVLNNDYNHINDYSIAISIIIGDFHVMLTGDLQDKMINYIDEELQRELITPNILKIPHHGSNASLKLLSLFSDDYLIDMSVCTAKKSSALPRDDSLYTYSQYSDRLYRIDSEATGCAVWGMEIDILNATVKTINTSSYLCV